MAGKVSKKQASLSFEERLNALEALVKQMEAGGLPLEETLKAYEQGTQLAESLKKDLASAQERLTVLKEDAGKAEDA